MKTNTPAAPLLLLVTLKVTREWAKAVGSDVAVGYLTTYSSGDKTYATYLESTADSL